MRNITVTVDDETYRLARLWATERNTTLSAVVRQVVMDLPRIRNFREFPLPEGAVSVFTPYYQAAEAEMRAQKCTGCTPKPEPETPVN